VIAFLVAFALVTLLQQSRTKRRLREVIKLIDNMIASLNRPTNYSQRSPEYNRAPRNIDEVNHYA